MAESRNRAFAKLAKDVTTEGNIKAEGISSDVTLGGATIYDTRSALLISGNTAGDQAYVTGNNRLYIWNGSGWYNVALLNVAPSIASVQDSDGNTTPFALAVDGTPTTITITAADSDGDPVTYSAIADSDFNGLATLLQDSSVFTITPFSQDSATTISGTITFKATDGVNIVSSGVQTFTLDFGTGWDQDGGQIVLHLPETGNPTAPNTYLETEVGANTNVYAAHSDWELVSGALVQRTTANRYLIHNGNYSQYETNSNNAFTVSWWSIANIIVSGPTAGGGGSYDWTMAHTYVDIAGGTSSVSFILQDNSWHHYAMISESGSLACKFYRDGTLITTVTMNSNTPIDLLSFSLNAVAANNNTGAGHSCAYSDVYLIDNHAAATEDFTPPTRTATFTGF